MDTPESLRYKDDTDKCYGVAGMVIGLSVYDKDKYIESVSVERADIGSIYFTPDFGYTVNQQLSAKATWRAMVEHFQTACGILLSNVMCRHMVNFSHDVPRETLNDILSLILEEGEEVYQLDNDECRMLLGNSYNHLYRVFSHPTVHFVAHQLYKQLKSEKTLYHSDITELLAALD